MRMLAIPNALSTHPKLSHPAECRVWVHWHCSKKFHVGPSAKTKQNKKMMATGLEPVRTLSTILARLRFNRSATPVIINL
jgi:hypothetical protein